MLKAVEDISPTKKRLRIEISSDAIEKEIGSTLQKLRQNVKLPGFRQGKAPLMLLEKRFGKEVEADVLERVISDSYQTAIKDAALRPVSRPMFEESIDFKRHSPLSMTLTVEVRPRLDNLKYEGIEVMDIPVEITDEDVRMSLERLQEEKAVYEPFLDEIKTGDIAVIDLLGQGAESPDQMLKVGTDLFPPEISEGLTGRKKGDSFSTQANFPPTFHIKELAGKNLNLKVLIKEVKRANLPPLDDEFAKDTGFDDLGALKDRIRDELLKAKKNAVSKIQKAEIMKRLIEENDFEAPETLVAAEIEHLLGSAKLSGNNEDEESLKVRLRPVALRNSKASLLLDIIGEKEGITVTEDELKKDIAGLSARLRMSPENVMKYFIAKDGSLEGLRHSMFEEKVLNLLLQKGSVTPPPISEEAVPPKETE